MTKLAEGSPEVEAVYRDHISYQGELLPHVLMGDITRLVISALATGECPEWLVSLLEQLDAGLLSGVPAVAELIGVSFVENLCGEDRAITVLRPKMGLALRRELRMICGV